MSSQVLPDLVGLTVAALAVLVRILPPNGLDTAHTAVGGEKMYDTKAEVGACNPDDSSAVAVRPLLPERTASYSTGCLYYLHRACCGRYALGLHYFWMLCLFV